MPALIKFKSTKATEATLLFCSSMTVLAGVIIVAALPQIENHYKAVPGIEYYSKMLLTLPGFIIVIFSPIVGWLLDRYGRRPFLVGGLVLYVLAGTTGLYVNSVFYLLVGRAVLGIAITLIMNTAVALVSDYWSGAERNRFMGLQGTFMAIGGIIFIMIGGTLATFGWRWPFAVYLAPLIALPLVFMHLPEPHLNANRNNDNHHKVAIDWPQALLIYGIGLLGMFIFYAVPVLGPLFVEHYLPGQPFLISVTISLSMTMNATAGFMYGRVKKRLSFYNIAALSFIIIFVGYSVISYSFNYGLLLTGMMITGLGAGLMMPNNGVWITTIAPAQVRGRLIAGLTMSIFLGQSVSGPAFANFNQNFGLHPTFLIMGIFSLVLFIIMIIARLLTQKKLKT